MSIIQKCCIIAAMAVALLLHTSLADAQGEQPFSGNQIVSACSDDRLGRNFCIGYVIGVWDGINTGAAAVVLIATEAEEVEDINDSVRRILGVCTPEGVNDAQLFAIFMAYLEENPSQTHYPARSLLLTAMQEAFPCPSE